MTIGSCSVVVMVGGGTSTGAGSIFGHGLIQAHGLFTWLLNQKFVEASKGSTLILVSLEQSIAVLVLG